MESRDVDVAHAVLPQRAPKKRRRRAAGAAAERDEVVVALGKRRGPESDGDGDSDATKGFIIGGPAVVRYAPERAEGNDAASRSPRSIAEEDEDEVRARRGVKYAYKDHTADIQIHSWGENLGEAFAWSALGMFDYMTPLEDCANAPTSRYKEIHASGHDLDTLLFAFLDELLFTFHTEMLICTSVQVCEFDRENWSIRAIVGGTTFVDGETRQGTEIKAITYSAMKIIERADIADGEHRAEVFVIVDI